VQPPLPSWGLMVSEGQTYLELDPWLSVLPSIALFMLIAGVQILSQSFTAETDMSAEIAKAQ
jgi:peptide/nickel transport system permease protein